MIYFLFYFLLLNFAESSSGPKSSSMDSTPTGCIVLHCPLEMGACLLNPGCFATLTCMTDCEDKPDLAQCQFECEMTLGINNEAFKDLLACMVKHGCMAKLPDDGTCLAGPDNTVQSITELDQVAGGWWVVRGVNCGQDDLWTGAYDWYPCQHGRYIQLEDETWVNNTTYCGGSDSVCTTGQIVTAPHATMPSPGLIRLEYDDAPLLPQIERWHIVAYPDSQFMMVMWCGENPVLNYNGGFVLSRSRTEAGMSPQTEAELRAVAIDLGVDYDSMCVTDNSACPEEP